MRSCSCRLPPSSAALWAIVVALSGCIPLPRQRVDHLDAVAYPTCPSTTDEAAPSESRIIASGSLRSGPVMAASQGVVEHFQLEQRDCLKVTTVSQEWSLSHIDVEIVYDDDWLPLRAWKRIVSPGTSPEDPRVDIRRFEMRGERVALEQLNASGERERFLLRGVRPTAIIAPGRGSLTAWFQKANLDVGGRLRETVLDMRESFEVIRDVTLFRLEDREDPVLGHVRVYTIYGREPVYTDEHNVVIGDLMGMLPADRVTEPMPVREPLAVPPPDPIGTP